VIESSRTGTIRETILKFRFMNNLYVGSLLISFALVSLSACSDGNEPASQMSMGAPAMAPKAFATSDGDFEIAIEPDRGEYASVSEPGAPGIELVVEEPTLNNWLSKSQSETSGAESISQSDRAPSNFENEDRVIIRSAQIDIEVQNIANALNSIGTITTSSGGWVVASEQTRTFAGSITIRVPAEKLDSVLAQIHGLSTKVRTSKITSQDLTEEFTDVSARAQTLRDTKVVLTELFERAENVEEALNIQKEITRVQSDLEALEGRIKFISESEAYSLINVIMQAAPMSMTVDAGPDIAVGVISTGIPYESPAMRNRSIFRARFTPPEGIEDFIITWNFGDGSPDESTDRVAPTTEGGELISASIVHYFSRDDDSPLIVTVKVRGFGDAGLAEGEDTQLVTVSRIPPIVVFAGTDQTVEASQNVELSGSFTLPESITDVKYIWDFGDGSPPKERDLVNAFSAGNVTTEHIFPHFRWNPYEVRLTVSGKSEIGEITGEATTYIYVQETVGVSSPDLNISSTIRSASRALQAVGVISVNILLWLAILSPAWIMGVLILLFLRKRNRSNIGMFSFLKLRKTFSRK